MDLGDWAVSIVALVLGIAFLAFVLSVVLAVVRAGWDSVRRRSS